MRNVRKFVGAILATTIVLAGATACTSGKKKPHRSSSAASSAGPSTPSGSVPATGSASSSGAAPAGPAGAPVPNGFAPVSVTFVSASVGWVLGTAPCSSQPCTSVLRTRDGGATWAGIPAPKAPLSDPQSTSAGVGELRFADALDGWAGVGDLYSTHDGGATWTAQTQPEFAGHVTGLGTSGGYVFVAVAAAQGSQVYASPVGKDAWALVGNGITGTAVTPTLIVQHGTWYLPTTTGIWRGHGTAAAARIANPCPGGGGIAGVAAADGNHLDALCVGNGAAGSAQYQLYGTTNGGAVWKAAGGPHIGPSGVAGIADNQQGVLLVAAESGASLILRTTDDGQTLNPASISAPAGGLVWTDLGFTTPTQAVVVLMKQGLYLSRDAGKSFGQVSF